MQPHTRLVVAGEQRRGELQRDAPAEGRSSARKTSQDQLGSGGAGEYQGRVSPGSDGRWRSATGPRLQSS